MSGKKNYSIVLVGICLLLVVGAATALVSAQQGKIVSSYGPTNQDVSFNQIKAARLARISHGRIEKGCHFMA